MYEVIYSQCSMIILCVHSNNKRKKCGGGVTIQRKKSKLKAHHIEVTGQDLSLKRFDLCHKGVDLSLEGLDLSLITTGK